MGGVDGYSCSAEGPEGVRRLPQLHRDHGRSRRRYYKAFNSPPVNTEAQAVVTEPYLKAVLAAYNKAPYVSQWLDTLYGQNVGNALNVAVVDLLAGKGTPAGHRQRGQRRRGEGLTGNIMSDTLGTATVGRGHRGRRSRSGAAHAASPAPRPRKRRGRRAPAAGDRAS